MGCRRSQQYMKKQLSWKATSTGCKQRKSSPKKRPAGPWGENEGIRRVMNMWQSKVTAGSGIVSGPGKNEKTDRT